VGVAQPPIRPVASIGRYELWMLAQAALGFVAYGGVIFLIPLHVLAEGGSPADTGSVVALIGLLGLAGPFVGSIADRFGAYRSLQIASLTITGLAALMFAFAREPLLWLVAAGLLGLGVSGTMVINTTFVVGAGFDHEAQSGKLALLQLSLPAGQVLGLAAVAGLGIRAMLIVMGMAGLLFAMGTAFLNGPAAQRLISATTPTSRHDDQPVTRTSLRGVLLSQFGLTLALTFLIFTGSEGIESQYASYMDAVFGIDPEVSAAALSVIMLITIPLYLVAGRWTAKSGPRLPFLASGAGRALGGLGLLLLPGSAWVGALILFGVTMFVFPLFELTAAVLASKTSPIGHGAAQGGLMAAYALGSIVGAVLGGWMAEEYGFRSLAWIAVVASGAATVLGIAMLRSSRPVST
jgi:predicted MFS family arabinose efflux permease